MCIPPYRIFVLIPHAPKDTQAHENSGAPSPLLGEGWGEGLFSY